MGAADLGSLVPVEAEPAHHVEQRVVGLLAVARGVGVLDPEHERAAVVARERPVEQGGAGQADVRGARRRRAEPHPDRRSVGRARRDRAHRFTTVFVRAPRPSIETSTSSPGCIGPTPSGVPVRITSPGSSVITLVMWATRVGMSKIRSLVEPSCTRSPLRWVWTRTPSAKSLRVEVGLDPGAERAEGVEALGAGPLPVLLLQVARGHVVGDRVAEDHVGGLLRRHVAADPADHHGELALVVDALRLRRVEDLVAGADHGGVGLEEHQRLLGHLAAHLGGVRGVVLPDRDHLAARDHRGQQPDVGEPVLGLRRLDPGVQRVAGQLDDDAVLGRLPELVELAGDHAVQRVVARGEPRNTHPATLPSAPSGRWISST